MNRKNNKNRISISEEIKKQVWDKAERPLGAFRYNLGERIDRCGNKVKWEDYRKQIDTGWEIDHIIPLSKGGTNNIENLQILQWQANRRKSDNDDSSDYC